MAKIEELRAAQETRTKISDKEQKWLDEEIEVEFLNMEEPGISVKFVHGSTNNAKKYHLFHGGKYKLSRNVVKHLESRSVPMWKWRPDGQGSMHKQIIGTKPRFQCRQIMSM